MKTLFVNAAEGLFNLIAELKNVEEKTSCNFNLKEDSREDLLVSWLSELHFVFETKGLIFSSFYISELNENTLRAEARGEKFDPKRHELKTDIKAVTFHQLKVEQSTDGWQAEVIFDL